MGGVGIFAAMETFAEKVAVAVFVTAFMRANSSSWCRLLPSKRRVFQATRFHGYRILSFHDGPENPPTSMLFGPKAMATKLYQLSPPEDLALGMMLVRPCPLFKDGLITVFWSRI
ncbi:unnamed protein product [Linum tenue]|uniref:Uncharacterized protein n=1 Tax=Linum tenue TaxID=586396 RepID=A0AAV0L4G3_9ROSI|nr:unnamed protein product [Linum tenue]